MTKAASFIVKYSVTCPASVERLSCRIMKPITRILQALEQGDPQAASQLLPLVYDELRRLAAQKLIHEKPGQTLDATALVHEAYLRLVGDSAEVNWKSRGHFFAAAAESMRRILIDNARAKAKPQARRWTGAARCRVPADCRCRAGRPAADPGRSADAPGRERCGQGRVGPSPLLRGFGSRRAAAVLLGISPATADRWWAYTRAWLHLEMTRIQGGEKNRQFREAFGPRFSHR